MLEQETPDGNGYSKTETLVVWKLIRAHSYVTQSLIFGAYSAKYVELFLKKVVH